MTNPIRGVIFDLDGTLIHQELDFEALRAEIGLPFGTPLLEAIAAMSATDRARAETILDRHESKAATSAVALPGLANFLACLDERGIRRAVLTRNSATSSAVALAQARLGGFDPVLAREHAACKPDPAGVLLACQHWGIAPGEALMVGDYLFDVRAGASAGARTALITHGKTWHFAAEADLVFDAFEPFPQHLGIWLGFE